MKENILNMLKDGITKAAKKDIERTLFVLSPPRQAVRQETTCKDGSKFGTAGELEPEMLAFVAVLAPGSRPHKCELVTVDVQWEKRAVVVELYTKGSNGLRKETA